MIIDVTKDTGPVLAAFFESKAMKDLAEEITNKCMHLSENSQRMIDLGVLRADVLEDLQAYAKERNWRGLQMLCASVIGMLKDPENARIGKLKGLPGALTDFFLRNAIDGWVYIDDGNYHVPYLIGEIKYVEPAKKEDQKPYVMMILRANLAAKTSRGSNISDLKIIFDSDDIVNQSLIGLLLAQNIYVETPELKALYLEQLERFRQFQPAFYQQFLITGLAYEQQYNDRVGKATKLGQGVAFKALNDEPQISRVFYDEINNPYWEQRAEQGFNTLPYHCLVYLYNLETHSFVWVHVNNMQPYVYKPELREKLVLPEDHKELIDILAGDLSLMEDMVDNKTGGTTILCSGPPGLGKTLTAEVYCEVIGRPLYRVHSGLLGTTAKEVEHNLKEILARAQRWGVVTLIDEADVYIRQRGDDIDHNAVVASFLRTLEYFSGLLFMTTNRVADVDDAILSRCIAHIKYSAPNDSDRRRLWEVLGEQFQATLTSELITVLCEKYNKVGGRDIKELLKLAQKFAKGKNLPMSEALFVKCAQFRGL